MQSAAGRRESDFNNLPMKAAMCCRFKVGDGGELGSQRLKGEKGRGGGVARVRLKCQRLSQLGSR